MKLPGFLLCLWLTFAAGAAPMGILVPAYFDPPALWSSLNTAATQVPLIAIMNPDSGPFTNQLPEYVTAVNALRANGGRVIGYVSTVYATRDTNAVRADIDSYFNFYTLDGIFLDEMTEDAVTNHVNYYAAMYQYIRTKGTNLLVAGNPGINTQETYLTRPCADILVTFESDSGYSNLVVDAWVTNHLARQFCHLPYNTPTATAMTNNVNLAVARNAGWIYVTDDNGDNPWDTLPPYWTNEVNYIRSLNQSAAATQLSVVNVSNRTPALRISGNPGVYELQTSSNLSNWSAAGTVSNLSNQVILNDTTASNASKRFYRTRQ